MVKKYKSQKGGEIILKTYQTLLKRWDVDYCETDVDTRYGSTHIIMAGSSQNPPLMLFHGVGDDAAMMWHKNAKAWSKKFHIFAIDTIGGPGKSEPNENYGKGFDQCLWIDDILNSLKLNEVNMAGVSNGAFITQLYGAKRPDRTNKLVCMAGALRVGDKEPGFFEVMKSMSVFFPEAVFPTKKNIVKLLNKLCGGKAEQFTADRQVMEHWEALLKHFNNMSMGFHKLKSISKHEVNNIKDRIFFILGDKDPIAYSQEALALFKEHEINYAVIENAGHSLNFEMPDIINQMVEDFILG